MKIVEIINQPEGRKIEFKEIVPSSLELCKTVVAFSNDAGGTIFIGIKDNPREIVGINEDELINLEEKISNIIFDNCAPLILPEITFHKINDKYILTITIFRGSNPPYHLKKKGIEKGTYIRVGSSNRLANQEIINELFRLKENISYDSIPFFDITVSNLNIHTFENHFLQNTGEKITLNVLKKLNLIVKKQNEFYPTNALILLSDDVLRKKRFPYAKIECARFKGNIPGNFIDQQTITSPLSLQAEEAYKFVLRNISKGSYYKGVYRKDRWEYPIIALREVIRNAVIHRDYSLGGMDIKIAIFDDKIEITSPGKLLPTIDFNDMSAGQSDIRNKTLAPVFKRLGIIEQWGNGLTLIANELKNYPEIDFQWSEPGFGFRVTLIKKDIQNTYDNSRPITTDYDRLRPIIS